MKKYELIERTNGSVSPAQMDTTEYPPEGQNVECDVHEAFADALAKNHFALNYCPKCGEKL